MFPARSLLSISHVNNRRAEVVQYIQDNDRFLYPMRTKEEQRFYNTFRSMVSSYPMQTTKEQRCCNVFRSMISLFFFLSWFSFTNIHDSQGNRERVGYLFNSSLTLPPATQTLRHQPGDYCRKLTSAHSQQPESSREPLGSERRSLTTKLCVSHANSTRAEVVQYMLGS